MFWNQSGLYGILNIEVSWNLDSYQQTSLSSNEVAIINYNQKKSHESEINSFFSSSSSHVYQRRKVKREKN